MVGILLTLLAVILVICLAFRYTEPERVIHEDHILWQKGRRAEGELRRSEQQGSDPATAGFLKS